MLPGLTISWPALEKRDYDTSVEIIGGLSQGAIIDKVFEDEVDGTFQGSRGLQSLQTQSGEAGSQGNPLYKKDMLTNFSALTNRFLSKYFVYIPQNVNLNACVLTFDENM